MRKVILFFVLILLCCSVFIPASAVELDAGYRFTADCALGNDIEFFIPTSNAAGSLTYDSSGNLFNLSSSTIYLYCPAYPDYTFSAGRFSEFTYRRTNYESASLNLCNVRTNNVEIFTEDPVLGHDTNILDWFHTIVATACFVIEFLLLMKWRNLHV